MSDEYANLDAIPNSIFDNIIIDNDMNMDEIFSVDFESLLYNDFDKASEVTVDFPAEDESTKEDLPSVKHDCMWSGTCNSEDHKKRNTKPFSVEAILKEFEKSSESESESDDQEIASALESNFPEVFRFKPQLYSQLVQPSLPSQQKVQVKSSPPPSPKPIIFTSSAPIPASLQFRQIPNPTVKQEMPNFTVINIQPATTCVNYPVGTLTKLEPTMNVIGKTENHITIKTVQPISQVIQQQQQQHITKVEPIYNFNQNFAKQPQNFPMQPRQFIPIIQNVTAVVKQSKKKPKNSKKVKRFKAAEHAKMMYKHRKYTRRNARIICDDNSEGTSVEKRSMHNDMERKRRIDMKNLFFELKSVIPTFQPQDRVAKVNILRAAISYCHQIQREEKLLMELRRKNKRLMTRMHKLSASTIIKANSIGLTSSSSSSSGTSSASSSFETYDEN